MKIILTLVKKELGHYLNSPLGYIAVVPFLAVSFFLYFRTAFVFGQASLRPYFETLPWFLLLLAPALTMNLLSEEKSRKTTELLFAHPLSYFQFVVAKFLSALLFFVLILLTTLPLVLPIFFFSQPDGGLILSQYLSALFLSGVFLAAAILASSLSASGVSAFLLGIFFNFILILTGLDLVTLSAPPPLNFILNDLSVLGHLESVAKGLIDISDLAYFAVLTSLFLLGAVYVLSRDKYLEDPKEKRKLNLALALILILGILLQTLLSRFPLRVDLTANRLYSLSAATVNLLRAVDDVVTLSLFVSPNLPPAAQNVAHSVQDILSDYQRQNGKIKVEKFSPQIDNPDAQKARSAGVAPIQFNTIGAASYQLQEGYLGLALRFGDKTEVLPYIGETDSLEYNLTRRLRKMVSDEKKRLVVYSFSGPAIPDATADSLSQIKEQLSTQYELVSLTSLDDKELESLPVLIVAGIKSELPTAAVDSLKKFSESGKKLILLIDKVPADASQTAVKPQKTGLEDWLKEWGISLNEDLAVDPALMETVQARSGQSIFLVPYPFWLKTLVDPGFIGGQSNRQVNLFWPSSLKLEKKDGLALQNLLTTSANGRSLSADGGSFNVSLDGLKNLNLPEKGEILTLAVLAKRSKPETELSVITDSEFIQDSYLNSQNLSFFSNLIDFISLGKDEVVPFKVGRQTSFLFSAPWQPVVSQWGITAGVPTLVSLYGLIRLWRRRRGFSRIYEEDSL